MLSERSQTKNKTKQKKTAHGIHNIGYSGKGRTIKTGNQIKPFQGLSVGEEVDYEKA